MLKDFPKFNHDWVANRLLYLKTPRFLWDLFLVLSVCVLAYQTFTQPKIVSFDLKKTLSTFYLQASHADLTKPQLKTLSHRFVSGLNQTVQDYAQTHHAIVLVKPAIVSGCEDITQQIQTEIAIRMAKEGSHAS